MTEITLLRNRYASVLTERLGLVVEMGDDVAMLLRFTDGGIRFMLVGSAQDPSFMGLHVYVQPTWLNGGEPVERQVAAAAAAELCRSFKVLKAFMEDDEVLAFRYELLVAPTDCLPTEETLLGVLPRAIKATHEGLADMHERLQLETLAANSA